jgi:hypothetical protein
MHTKKDESLVTKGAAGTLTGALAMGHPCLPNPGPGMKDK